MSACGGDVSERTRQQVRSYETQPRPSRLHPASSSRPPQSAGRRRMLRTHENKRPLTAPREQETADRPEGGAGGDLSSSAHHFRVICQLRRDSADRDSAETEFTECSCADGWRSPVSTVTASQPASLVVSAATAPAARTRDRVRRPPRGRPAWSPRAPLPGDTSTRLSRRETRPPARPAPPPHHHHACC